MKALFALVFILALSFTAVLPSTQPASAKGPGYSGLVTPVDYRYRGRHYGPRRHYRPGRYYGSRRYRRGGPSFSIIIGGGVPYYRPAPRYYVAPPRYIAPPVRRARPVYGLPRAHYDWCYSRYRSYRASDNSFQPYNGPRRACYSPYS